MTPREQRIARIGLAVLVALMSATMTYLFWSQPRPTPSDFSQVWAGARAFVHGLDPYKEIGPGRSFDWPFLLLYPFPALLVALPFAALPLRAVDPIFVALSGGLLSIALTRRRIENPQILVFISLPYWYFLQTSQWSALLTTAAMVPWIGFVFACKPTIAMAILAGWPRVRAIVAAGAFTVVSLLVWPTWWREWLHVLPTATHVLAPVVLPGGFLALAVVFKWRRPEARMLAAFTLVPHTVSFYELIPFFLIVESWWEGWALWVLSIAAYVAHRLHGTYPTYEAYIAGGASWIVWLVYLPCAALILTRPNISPATIGHSSRGTSRA